MKKKICSFFLIAAMLSSNFAFCKNHEVVAEPTSSWNTDIGLPLEFKIKKSAKSFWTKVLITAASSSFLYSILKVSHNSVFTYGEEGFFAEGGIVEWPEDKNRHIVYNSSSELLASASLYHLLNAEGDILVLRDSSEAIIGYMHVYNKGFKKLFEPITVTLYDRHGVPILESVYGYNKLSFNSYSPSSGETPKQQLIEAKHHTFSRNYSIKLSSNMPVDPALLLIALQVQTSKESFVQLSELYLGYAGNVDFNDLEGFTQGRAPLDVVKKGLSGIGPDETADYGQWIEVLEILSKEASFVHLEENEKERLIRQMSLQFPNEEITPEQTLDLKDSLSDIEKGILCELINERLSFVVQAN